MRRFTIAYRCSVCVTNVVGKSISSVTMWIIVNHIGKHDLPCRPVLNNLTDKNKSEKSHQQEALKMSNQKKQDILPRHLADVLKMS